VGIINAKHPISEVNDNGPVDKACILKNKKPVNIIPYVNPKINEKEDILEIVPPLITNNIATQIIETNELNNKTSPRFFNPLLLNNLNKTLLITANIIAKKSKK